MPRADLAVHRQGWSWEDHRSGGHGGSGGGGRPPDPGDEHRPRPLAGRFLRHPADLTGAGACPEPVGRADRRAGAIGVELARHPGVRGGVPELGGRGRHRGRGAVGDPRPGRDLQPHRRQASRGQRPLRPPGGGLRAHRRDIAAPVPSRGHELVHRAHLPGRAAGGEDDPAAADQAHVHADRRRPHLRRGRAAPPQPGRRPSAPHQRPHVVRAAGGEPGEDGDRRSEANLHVPLAVRLSRRTRTSASGRTSKPSIWRP